MKAIITLLAIIVMSSCGNDTTKYYTVECKTYKVDGWCTFSYREYDMHYISIDDSCNKYNVGDTVKH